MDEPPQKSTDKKEIITQIGDLSKLLGMIPSDDTVMINEPVTQNSMELSKWFDDTRKSFLRLSILLDRALDLNLP
jgi:hypothetical protein